MTREMPQLTLDQLARLYFRLLDLSRDVDRNRDDAAHEESGGKIWYVFDATVLETFINPHDARARATSLYAPEWGAGGMPADEARMRASQTALACMEYLLGGALPCQQRGAIYMTEWHRWEFQHRAEVLQAGQISRLSAIDPKTLRGRFDGITAVLDRMGKSSQDYQHSLDDPQLLKDLDAFERMRPDPEELKTFVSTRMSVRVLAEDEVLEPARQLSRLVTAPLRYSLSTLHLALPPSKNELGEIVADADRWMTRLREECKRRGISVITRGSGAREETGSARHEQALSNDAYSLAMVRWAARKKAQTVDERLVFVTADNVVFDTYRRWYAELGLQDLAYCEAFPLRRLIQYAPVFNLVSSGRLEGEQSRELFQDLQTVLEKISATLNMSLLTRHKAPIVERMLELTALRLTDPRSIRDDIAYAPLVHILQGNFEEYRRELQQVITRWRDLERAALGRAGDAVQRRIQSALAADELLAALESDATTEAYQRLLEDLVQTLVAGPQHVSLHMAREYLNSWPAEGRRFARAPIALRITVETPSGPLDIGERLDQRLSGDLKGDFLDTEEQWKGLYAQPALLFAIAAAHCVVSNDWTNAQQFVEIALTEDVDPDLTRHAPAVSHQLAEIRYLAALVYRFRMGEIAPPLTGESFARMSRFYRLARGHIEWCEAFHVASDTPHPLRLLRARSERAALNLFYCSALTPAVHRAHLERHAAPGKAPGDLQPGLRAAANPPMRFGTEREALAALERAEMDLLSCLVDAREMEGEASGARKEFLGKLVRQATTNACAAAVLRRFWGLDFDSAPPLLRPGNSELVASARARLCHMDGAGPTAVRADLLGFLTLSGDEYAASELAALPRIELLPGNLSLDAAVVDAIRGGVQRLRLALDVRSRGLPGGRLIES